MAKGSNQKIKILYLMKIFLERTDEEHGLTLQQLTDALEEYGVNAERKTLYDDIETLRVFGLDIEKSKAKTVTYRLVSREYELPELKLLVDAVQSAKFITRQKSDQLIRKIENLASCHEAQKLQRQVYITNRVKTLNESIYYAVDAIHEAIGNNVQVSFQYFSWNEKKEKVLHGDGAFRVVSPFALTWDDENYYMIAYDSAADKMKHYRVDKMLKLTLTDIPRDGAALFAHFDAAVYANKMFGMFGGEEQTVKLRCHNRLAGVMIDRFGQDITMVPSGTDHFEVRIKACISPLFLAWMTNFGADVTVVSPDSVKQALVAHAKAVLDNYQ